MANESVDGEVRDVDMLAMLELGSTGLNRWGYDVYEEFLPGLRYPYAAQVFKEMSENDPTVGAVLYMSEQLIRKAGWKVVPGGDKPADKDAALFLEQCMNDMTMSWSDTISEVLSMLTYGWSFHEIVYKLRKGPDSTDSRMRSKYNDGRIGWRKIPIRSQHTLYGWIFDDDGDVKAMIQQAPPHFKMVTIPLCKGLLFRTKVARDNPEGRSLLRSAYRPWYFKKRIEEIEGIGIERDLAGLPVLTPPENINIWNPEDKQAIATKNMAEQLVRNVRRDKSEGVVIPFGWKFDLMNTGGSRQFDTNAIVNRYDQRIAITMLADIVMLGADKVGSFALADVKKSLLAASLEAQLDNIASVFNTFAVPDLFKFNYFPGITDYPQIQHGEVETPSLKELGDFFRATGMRIDDDYELNNYIRQVASLPKLTQKQFDILRLRRDQARQQTNNATAQHQQNATNSAMVPGEEGNNPNVGGE